MHKALVIVIIYCFLFSLSVYAQNVKQDTKQDKNHNNLSKKEQQVLYEAKILFQQKKYKESKQALLNYIDNNNGQASVLIFYMLGNAWYMDQNIKQAYEAYKKAHNIDSEFFPVCLNLAKTAYELEQYNEAGKFFEKAHQSANLTEKKSNLLYEAAIAYYHGQSFLKAKQILKDLISSSKRVETEWLKLLINICLELKQWDESKKLVQNFLEKHPLQTEYWKLLSQISIYADDYKSAVYNLEIAYSIEPATKKELEDLSQLYLYLNLPLKAAKTLEKAYKQNCTLEQYKKISNLYANAQQLDKAIFLLDLAIKKNRSFDLIFQKARLYYDWGKWDKAIDSLQNSLSLNPDHELANLLLGYCALEKEDFTLASKAFLKASKGTKYKTEAIHFIELINEINSLNSTESINDKN